MIRRILDALQGELAGQGPQRRFRPNELSREAVRAERLRREARQPEVARQAAPSPVQEVTRRERPATGSTPRTRAEPLAASLKSRPDLRRAMLLKEILGPPAALRWPRGGEPDL